jgi:hypothetical protein
MHALLKGFDTTLSIQLFAYFWFFYTESDDEESPFAAERKIFV